MKKHAIIYQGLPQILRAGLPLSISLSDSRSRAIIFHDTRIIDREVCRGLFEAINRITASLHHLENELIGFHRRATGIVDEAILHPIPGMLVMRAVVF